MIKVNVLNQNPIHVAIRGHGFASVAVPDYHVIINDPPVYRGEYTATPGVEPVTLKTNHQLMMDDVTINAIPKNYGKITWNGSVLTVS